MKRFVSTVLVPLLALQPVVSFAEGGGMGDMFNFNGSIGMNNQFDTCKEPCAGYFMFAGRSDKEKGKLQVQATAAVLDGNTEELEKALAQAAVQGACDADPECAEANDKEKMDAAKANCSNEACKKAIDKRADDAKTNAAAKKGISRDPKCYKQNPIAYSQIGPHCEASYMADQAASFHSRAVTMYMAATAVCGTACAAYSYFDVTSTAATAESQASIGKANAATASACVQQTATTTTSVGTDTSCTQVCALQSAVQTAVAANEKAVASGKVVKIEEANKTGSAPVLKEAITTNCIDATNAAAAWTSVNTASLTATAGTCAAQATAIKAAATAGTTAWGSVAQSCAGYKVWRWFCSGGMITAGLNDLASYNKLKETGKKSVDDLSTLTAAAGLAVGGVAFVQAVGAPSAEFLSTCHLAAISGAITIQRNMSFQKARKTAKDSCDQVKEQVKSSSSSAAATPCAPPAKTAALGETSFTGSGAGTRASATGGRQGVGAGAGISAAAQTMGDFNNPALEQAATAGVGGDIMPFLDKDGLKNGANDLGMSTEEMAQKLLNGESPSAIMSAMQAPEGLSLGPIADGLKAMEAQAAKGDLFDEGAVAGTAYSGGGGGGRFGGAKTPFTPMTSKAGAGGGGKPAEMNFGKKDDKPVIDSTDIWHANFKGSIFDIITRKTNESRTKVSTLEYVIPFNRVMSTEGSVAVPPTTQPGAPAPHK